MRSNGGMADRGTSTSFSRKSPPPVNTLAWLDKTAQTVILFNCYGEVFCWNFSQDNDCHE